MVLGSGMIATALKSVDREDVLYAASGLSNLQGNDPVAREREETLIKAQLALHPDKLFVYISSYSIDDQYPEHNTAYLTHKLHMENLVKSAARRYLILRTSNVVGNSRQPGNLMNFIFSHLQSGTSFEVWTQTSRNLIDVADLALMADLAVAQGYTNDILFMTHPGDIPIYHIVLHFEALSGLKGHYRLTDKGAFYRSDKGLASAFFDRLGLDRDPEQYTRQLIEKYFRHKFRAG